MSLLSDSPLLWLVIAAAIICGVTVWQRRARIQKENFQRLTGILRDLAEGRQPRGVLFSDRAGQFSPLTPLLDRVASELTALRNRPREEESRLEGILGGMQEGVMVADAQHHLHTVNPAFLTMFKVTRDPRGQSVLQTLREAAFDELITKALATGEAHSAEVELSGTKPRRFIMTHVNPTRDHAGTPGVVAIFRETTRLKQLEDVRREFVANVSHELRTPLSIFHGYLEMLTDAPDMPRGDRLDVYEVLRRNSRRLNAILEDLLTLARLESRKERLNTETIDVAEFLRGTFKDWERNATAKKLIIQQDVAAHLPPLRADRLRLEQVFNNLLDNAVKYTDAGGQVAVRARATDGHVEFRVEDSGRGIPPTDLPHIFERFYRADKARSREQGGTGLGLSIVKHIVQSHGGTVAAESTYAKGTAIIVRLPVGSPPSDAPADAERGTL